MAGFGLNNWMGDASNGNRISFSAKNGQKENQLETKIKQFLSGTTTINSIKEKQEGLKSPSGYTRAETLADIAGTLIGKQ